MSEEREELLEMPTIINFDPTVNDKAERIYKLSKAMEFWIAMRDRSGSATTGDPALHTQLVAVVENMVKEIEFTTNELDAIWRRAKQQ